MSAKNLTNKVTYVSIKHVSFKKKGDFYMKSSSFIRDLLVKVLLIVIFIFLLMYLFPMPNLKPFYSSIFNNNIQTMKDAAEDYYTTERMPKENGKSTKMTLQDMIDDKLIIPFVDKDGKSCDTKKSYVKVTKKDKEYELKVSLTCGKDSDYIIEKIGCYNFCPTGTCTLAEIKQAEAETKTPIKTVTDKDGNVRVVVPTGGRYVYEYEYKRVFNDEKWRTGDWTNTKERETTDVKLVDTRTQYTGQKKVTSGTTIREEVSYGDRTYYTYDENWKNENKCDGDCSLWKERTLYTGQKKNETKTKKYIHNRYAEKDNWTYDENWTTDTTCTPKTIVGSTAGGNTTLSGTCQLWQERTLYTGQKKVSTGTKMYIHERYGTKDNWTYDDDWTTDVKQETDNLKLWKSRTLYTGQKLVTRNTTKYLHVKYNNKYEWNETGWTTINRAESDDVKLIDKRYTVKKSTETTTTKCDNYQLDTTWYSSKPADTATRKYSSTPANTQTSSNWVVIKDSFKSYNALPTYQGEYWYEFLYSNKDTCVINCNENSKTTVYYYRVYEKRTSNRYQYKYCTPTTTTTPYTDEKVVSDPTSYVNNGYTITKTEYNYKVRKTIRYVEAYQETESITPPAGYEYTGQSATSTVNSYISLGKWVTNKEALGEYTYNVKTTKQYKYAHNNPTRYFIEDTATTSITPPAGFEYSGRYYTVTKNTYVSLGKWVTNREALGEYTYNIITTKQYKYAYNNPYRYFVEDIETDSITPPAGFVYSGKNYTITKITYTSLGKWVTSIDKLGEYSYNIKTAKQYKHKYKHTEKYEKDRKWTTNTYPDEGYEFTGNTKTVKKDTYIDLGKWVNKKSDLGEYTYNIKTRTQYKYKYRTTTTRTEYKWARSNPGNGFEPTGNYRKIYIPDYSNKQK